VARRALATAAALAVIAACAGCSLGAGAGKGDVTLRITEGFGSRTVRTVTAARVPGSETVLRMLRHSFTVQTRNPSGIVESIDGQSAAGDQSWFYSVNGVQANPGSAATTTVHQGDSIWWDLHDGQATDSIPAVVGSYPEPFLNGLGGKRYPTTLECGSGLKAACKAATAALNAVHIPVSSQLIGTGSGPDTLGVVVGTWPQVRPELAAELIQHGPGAGGVYARFAGPDGDALQLLGPSGEVVRTLGAGAGLVAATADPSEVPTWLITGTDPAGVLAAAKALTPQALHNHLALAVDGQQQVPLPAQPSS